MKTIKQYITKNKQPLFVIFTSMCYLFIYSIAFCSPVFILTLMPNLPEKLAYEFVPYIFNKAVTFTPYAVQGAGWFVVGSTITLTGIKVAEYGYNWKYIIGSAANTVPFAEEFKSGFRKFYGWMTGKQISPVKYTYFYPKLAAMFGDPEFFTKKLVLDLKDPKIKLATDKDFERIKEKKMYHFIDRPDKQIEYRERPVYTPVTEHVDKPIYVPHPVYKDRENLSELREDIKGLKKVLQDANLIQQGINFGSEGIAEEFTRLARYNDVKYLREQGFSDNLFLKRITFQFRPSTETVNFRLVFGSLKGEDTTKKSLNFLEWREEFPILSDIFNGYSAIDLERHSLIEGAVARPSFVQLTINYKKEGSGLFAYNTIDPISSTFSAITFPAVNAIEAGANILEQRQETVNENVQQLVDTINQKIGLEERLLHIQKKSQGTQTIDFGVNAAVFEQITTFLTPDEQAKLKFVSRDGELLYIDREAQAIIESETTVEKKVETMEMSAQTEYTTVEEFRYSITNTADSNIFQNMATLFSVVLVGAIASDIQTAELIAKTILGFTHIPEYNDAFLAATKMSVVQLQSEYNLGLEEAKKAFVAIRDAYDIQNPESVLPKIKPNLSEEVVKTTPPVNWKYLMLTGLFLIGSAGAGYLAWQAIKNGTPVESFVPDVNSFEKDLLKGLNK